MGSRTGVIPEFLAEMMNKEEMAVSFPAFAGIHVAPLPVCMPASRRKGAPYAGCA